jgi:hypothetical protein
MQMNIESYFENIANLQEKKAIIVTDRGVCDNFAYCSESNKNKMIEENKWSFDLLCYNRYDAIVHLVTAALGAEKAYTLSNN